MGIEKVSPGIGESMVSQRPDGSKVLPGTAARAASASTQLGSRTAMGWAMPGVRRTHPDRKGDWTGMF
jgi:hypothetical protein